MAEKAFPPPKIGMKIRALGDDSGFGRITKISDDNTHIQVLWIEDAVQGLVWWNWNADEWEVISDD